MINTNEILETIQMIDQQHLDVRTITMGISLLDCCDADAKRACEKLLSSSAKYLVYFCFCQIIWELAWYR